MNKKRTDYERFEITFSKSNAIEMELWGFLLQETKDIGKSKYIKNLIYKAKNEK